MRCGFKRSGRFVTTRMLVKDRFDPTLSVTMPVAYVFPKVPGTDSVIHRLRLHGVVVEQTKALWLDEFQRFMIDSIVKRGQAFQGHAEVRLEGRWIDQGRTFFSGVDDINYVVRTSQPLGVLAVELLEPQSDDGLVTWNFWDFLLDEVAKSTGSKTFPVHRITKPIAFPTRIIP